LVLLAAAIGISGWFISAYMEARARPEIFGVTTDVPAVDAVIVPGASVYRSGKLSRVLERRMETALELVRARPGLKLVLSGTTVPNGYSETRAMHEYALARGLPPEDILLDDEGRSTFLTLLNCRTRFGLKRVAIVSQAY